MNTSLHEQLLDFEKSNDLFSRTYCGENYWHILRFSIGREIWTNQDKRFQPLSANQIINKSKSNIYKTYLWYFSCTIREVFAPRLRPADILANDWNAYKDIDGIETDIFIDPLRESFDILSIYHDLKQKSHTTRKYPDTAQGMLRFNIINAFSKRFKTHIDLEENRFLLLLEEKIYQEFGVRIKDLAKRARWHAVFVKSFSKYARKLLEAVKPKAILWLNHYTTSMFVITKEAKNMGIPVIELQHGEIGLTHLAYNFTDTIGSAKYFPDYILTFGDYWIVNMRLPKGSIAVPVGSVYAEARIKKLAYIKRQEKLIVFYSNFNKAIIDVLMDLIGLAKENNYNLVCKLHPREYENWKTLYPELEQSGVEVIDYSMDIYELFLSGKHHVCGGSTTAFEAVATGGVVHLDISAQDICGDLTELGVAQAFSSADELMCNILELDSNSVRSYNNNVANSFFESNALENQINAIKNIIEQIG